MRIELTIQEVEEMISKYIKERTGLQALGVNFHVDENDDLHTLVDVMEPIVK